jgi:hypothetical protein
MADPASWILEGMRPIFSTPFFKLFLLNASIKIPAMTGASSRLRADGG